MSDRRWSESVRRSLFRGGQCALRGGSCMLEEEVKLVYGKLKLDVELGEGNALYQLCSEDAQVPRRRPLHLY